MPTGSSVGATIRRASDVGGKHQQRRPDGARGDDLAGAAMCERGGGAMFGARKATNAIGPVAATAMRGEHDGEQQEPLAGALGSDARARAQPRRPARIASIGRPHERTIAGSSHRERGASSADVRPARPIEAADEPDRWPAGPRAGCRASRGSRRPLPPPRPRRCPRARAVRPVDAAAGTRARRGSRPPRGRPAQRGRPEQRMPAGRGRSRQSRRRAAPPVTPTMSGATRGLRVIAWNTSAGEGERDAGHHGDEQPRQAQRARRRSSPVRSAPRRSRARTSGTRERVVTAAHADRDQRRGSPPPSPGARRASPRRSAARRRAGSSGSRPGAARTRSCAVSRPPRRRTSQTRMGAPSSAVTMPTSSSDGRATQAARRCPRRRGAPGRARARRRAPSGSPGRSGWRATWATARPANAIGPGGRDRSPREQDDRRCRRACGSP